MTEQSISLVVISDRIVFNSNLIESFETFSVDDTKLLFSTLLINLLDNLQLDISSTETIIYIDEKDSESLPNEIQNNLNNYKQFFYKDKPDISQVIEKTKPHKFSIIIYADVMGISKNYLNEVLKLLNTDENTIVIGTSINDSICLIGFNHKTDKLQLAIQNAKRNYSNLLALLKADEQFIYTINGLIRVVDIKSFKELYDNLSQKKSIEYCSQENHEKFTHLFVEYKELLQ